MPHSVSRSMAAATILLLAGLGPVPVAADSSAATAAANPPGQELSAQQLKDAQQALARRGLYNGPIDGLIGPDSRAAISAFQRATGLPASGDLTPETFAALAGKEGGGVSGVNRQAAMNAAPSGPPATGPAGPGESQPPAAQPAPAQPAAVGGDTANAPTASAATSAPRHSESLSALVARQKAAPAGGVGMAAASGGTEQTAGALGSPPASGTGPGGDAPAGGGGFAGQKAKAHPNAVPSGTAMARAGKSDSHGTGDAGGNGGGRSWWGLGGLLGLLGLAGVFIRRRPAHGPS